MSNLKVPAIFNKDYIDSLVMLNKKYKESKVVETYGCLPYDIIGNARLSSKLPTVSIENLEEYISYSRQNGISFNYIMNTTCHGNISHTELNKLLQNQLALLIELGVKKITVSTPYMIQFIYLNYPEINVTASINMCTSAVTQVKQLKEMGADCIVLERNTNRNFQLLKQLKSCSDVNIELLTNQLCLPFCIMYQYHNNLNSHYLQDTDEKMMKYYPYSQCVSSSIRNPVQMLCSGWIRPEDLKMYHKLGITRFKLEGRGVEKDIILEVIEHYLKQEYNGNFFDLMFGGRTIRHYMSLHLDNRKLDDFLSNIIIKDNVDCRYCGGKNKKCINIAHEITFNEQKRNEILQRFKNESKDIFQLKGI